jgi:hypothetical protein
MKKIFLIGLALISTTAFAQKAKHQPKEKVTKAAICQKLVQLAEDDCVSLMCDEGIENGDFEDISDCVGASDYAEAAQATCEDTLSSRVDEYNHAHPKANLTCEEE